MNGISRIEIGLENCEVITIDGKYIGAFYVENIKTTISRMGCNYIGKYQSCDSFVIEINRGADCVNKPFGIDDEDSKMSIFKRLLTFRDITSIRIFYDKKNEKYEDVETGETDEFYVPYEEECEGQLGSPNVYQSCYINSYGDLYIVISKDDKIEDFFDIEEIEDEEFLNFQFSMMDIVK